MIFSRARQEQFFLFLPLILQMKRPPNIRRSFHICFAFAGRPPLRNAPFSAAGRHGRASCSMDTTIRRLDVQAMRYWRAFCSFHPMLCIAQIAGPARVPPDRAFLSDSAAVPGKPCARRASEDRAPQPHMPTMTRANMRAPSTRSSMTANSSGPCMLFSVSGLAQPKATPPSMSCT